MGDKPLFRSKTTWVAIVAIMSAAGAYFTGAVPAWEAGQLILAALGGMALRHNAKPVTGG